MARKCISLSQKTTKDGLRKFSQTFYQSRKYTQAPFSAAFGHLRVKLSEVMLNILYGIVEIFTLSDLWKDALREDKKTNWQSANQSQTCVQM